MSRSFQFTWLYLKTPSMLAETVKWKCAQEVMGLNLGLNTDCRRNGFDGSTKFSEANVVTACQLGHNRFLPNSWFTNRHTIHLFMAPHSQQRHHINTSQNVLLLTIPLKADPPSPRRSSPSGWWWRKMPPDMEDSKQRVVLQAWARCWQTLTLKPSRVTKHFTMPQTATDTLQRRRHTWKFGVDGRTILQQILRKSVATAYGSG